MSGLRGRSARLVEQIKSGALVGGDLAAACLTGADLRGARLNGANLAGADLRGADLSGTDLNGANLRGANLAGITAVGCDFTAANLSAANLAGATLVDNRFLKITAVEADFSQAAIRESTFVESNLTAADFWGAELRTVCFDACDLTRAVFDLSPQRGVSFVGANLAGVSFRDVAGHDLATVRELARRGASVGFLTRQWSGRPTPKWFEALFAALLLLGYAFGVWYTWFRPTPETLLPAMWRAWEDKDAEKARRYMAELRDKYVDSLNILAIVDLLHAQMAEGDGDLRGAVAYFRVAASLAEEQTNIEAEALYGLARAELRRRHDAEASRYAEQMLQLVNRHRELKARYSAAALRIQADLLTTQERYEEAIQKLTSILKQAPGQETSETLQAIIDTLNKQIERSGGLNAVDETIQMMDRLAAGAPGKQLKLAIEMEEIQLLLRAKRRDEAFKRFESFCRTEIGPNDIPPNVEMLTAIVNGFANADRDKASEDAKDFYRRGVAATTAVSDKEQLGYWMMVQLGNLYFSEGDDDRAVVLWERVVDGATEPYSLIHAYEGIGNALIRRGKYAQAQGAADDLEARVGTEHAKVIAVVMRARAEFGRGRTEAALAMLKSRLDTCGDPWSCCVVLRALTDKLRESGQNQELKDLLDHPKQRWAECAAGLVP